MISISRFILLFSINTLTDTVLATFRTLFVQPQDMCALFCSSFFGSSILVLNLTCRKNMQEIVRETGISLSYVGG